MKTILATLVTVVIGLVALPDTAEARSHGHSSSSSSYTYVSGRASCGCTTYTKRVFTGYDCHRHPIYRYYSVPVVHRCRSSHNPHYSSHSSHSNYYSGSRYSSYRGHSSHINLRTRYGSVRICR
ncbi:MAG: hypothetical protein QNL01_14855 [Akkermansiaceae bacterium]